MLDGIPVQVDASIGLAPLPDHAQTAVELLKHADVAMYQAKRDRAARRAYREERNDHSRDRLVLLGELRAGDPARRARAALPAPGRGRHRRASAALEALVRWQHPVHGRSVPAGFLPSVEQTSLMRPFTERVIADALAQAAAWADGPLDVPIAVNVAAANLLDADFPATVARLLRDAGIAPAALCIEVTENAVMADTERTPAALARLRELGVRLSIDDFGTGHSSLARLKHLPVDELKIDKGFVLRHGRGRPRRGDRRGRRHARRAARACRRRRGRRDAGPWHRLHALGCRPRAGLPRQPPAAARRARAVGADARRGDARRGARARGVGRARAPVPGAAASSAPTGGAEPEEPRGSVTIALVSALPGEAQRLDSTWALEDWRRVVRRIPEAHPFVMPEWQRVWWAHFGTGRLSVLPLRDGAEPVAVVPVHRDDAGVVRFLGGVDVTDYPGPAIAPGHAPGRGDAAPTCSTASRRTRPGRSSTCAKRRPEDGFVPALAAAAAKAGLRTSAHCADEPIALLDLPATWTSTLRG